MRKSPRAARLALKASPPVPAPDSVPAIPSGYEAGSIGLLTLEGEEPCPALVMEKSDVGAKFQVWNMTPEGGFSTIDAPWSQIRFKQSAPPERGSSAVLRMCVNHVCDDKLTCYAFNMGSDGDFGDVFFRLVKAYHYALTPEEIVEDLFRHAFIESSRSDSLSGWLKPTSLSLKRVRELCTAPKGRDTAQKMMKYAMKNGPLKANGQRILFEIWMANARALRKQHYKIADRLAQGLEWTEVVTLLSREVDDALITGWLDAWMHVAAAGRLDAQVPRCERKTDTIRALREQQHRASSRCTRDAWLSIPSLKEVARVWGLTPEDFLDQYILNR